MFALLTRKKNGDKACVALLEVSSTRNFELKLCSTKSFFFGKLLLHMFQNIVHRLERTFYDDFWTEGMSVICMSLRRTGPKLLRVAEANEVPISSHIWVASMTFKQF